MRVAARWVGWHFFALAASGTLFATVATLREEPHHDSAIDDLPRRDFTWRSFAIEQEEGELAAQDCFDHNSGLAAVQRDDDERTQQVVVEEGGRLAGCLRAIRSATSRLSPPPAGVFLHQRVVDPWAQRTEPELFPSVTWHRCTGVTPSHVADAADEQMASLYAAAEACLDGRDFVNVDLELTAEGRVHGVLATSVVPQVPRRSPALRARTACIVHAMCQYRFEEPYGELHFVVTAPEAP